jgi:hypothetical protein
MALVNSKSFERQAIADLLDLVTVDGLPNDPAERLETLRLLAKSDSWVPTHCPETGIALDGIDPVKHANQLWPDSVPLSRMSPDAIDREAALYRAGRTKVPVRRG